MILFTAKTSSYIQFCVQVLSEFENAVFIPQQHYKIFKNPDESQEAGSSQM